MGSLIGGLGKGRILSRRNETCRGIEIGMVRSSVGWNMVGWESGRRRDWRSSIGKDDKDLY